MDVVTKPGGRIRYKSLKGIKESGGYDRLNGWLAMLNKSINESSAKGWKYKPSPLLLNKNKNETKYKNEKSKTKTLFLLKRGLLFSIIVPP